VDECKPLPSMGNTMAMSSPAAALRREHTADQGLTLVPTSAQLELALPISAQLKLTLSPIQLTLTRECVPKRLKLSSNVSVVFPKVLKLSSEVSESKPLPRMPGWICPSRGSRRPGAYTPAVLIST
jgi:hypothetical protein